MTRSGELRGDGSGKSRQAKVDESENHIEFASRHDAADYIADYLAQLLVIAFKNDLSDLAYYIGMSLVEAKKISSHGKRTKGSG